MIEKQEISLPGSDRIYQWIFKGILNILLVFILFFCTTNTLIPFPIDKVMIVVLLLLIAVSRPNEPIVNAEELLIITLLFSIAAVSSLVNLIIAPMIFFPVIGITFAMILRKHPKLILSSLYYALMINIICGLVFDVLAFAGVSTLYVSSAVKGFSFLNSPHGFTSTVQTFGTLCIIWLILYMIRGKLGMNNYIDRILFCIDTIAIIATFNRSTLLFWMVIIFFKQRKLFWTIVLFLLAFLVKFWEQIITFATSAESLISRSELLEGFNLSFVQSHSLMVYLFGRGTNQLSPKILAQVKWFTRSDLENGYAMILHSYGSIGLLFYLVLCISFIIGFLKLNKFAEAAILFYYFFVTQYLTQEFVSVSFYFFVAVMLLLYDLYKRNPPLYNNQSVALT